VVTIGKEKFPNVVGQALYVSINWKLICFFILNQLWAHKNSQQNVSISILVQVARKWSEIGKNSTIAW